MSEARFGTNRCPACAGVLEALPHAHAGAALSTGEHVAPMSLCSSCCGVWFDWWAGEASGQPHGDGACPRDHTSLVSQPYLDKGPLVRRCPRCMGLFARREQVDELAHFAERLPEAPPPIEDRTILARLWRLLS
ncbi:MAG: hypothetical protein ABI321_04905 [Polyangia bacterium]